MNIEKERELFERKWAGYNGFNLMLDWDDVSQRYKHDVTHFAFSSWLASRNREGYVLVPVEATQDMIEHGYRCGSKSIPVIYKVMLDALNE